MITLNVARFQCAVCGKLTSGRKPRSGDLTVMYPRRHMHNGNSCPGSFQHALWVDVPETPKAKLYFQICPKCSEEKPATPEYFHRDKNRKNGLGSYCKPCVKEKQEKYDMSASATHWRKSNPERYNEYQRQYRVKHQEKYRERWRRYYRENAEKIKEYQRRYRENNLEKVHEKERRYRNNNRVRINAQAQQRRKDKQGEKLHKAQVSVSNFKERYRMETPDRLRQQFETEKKEQLEQQQKAEKMLEEYRRKLNSEYTT